ncbi:DUF3179 domain-containing (seleno)protein [Fulvivirgaceae bacterium BMA12]|uniref:DUF3179 domain-containing (Seleno)protein n=1 Tax=Agaribacillus aureus TaxID=3051825 RepID=A0ABT8L6Y6_9BACT|nr:DUF3179 domain-containing (seleno)protein [Fulvivirgaceae bacterium BMA12]
MQFQIKQQQPKPTIYRILVILTLFFAGCSDEGEDPAPPSGPPPAIVNIIHDEFESEKYAVYANSTFRTMVAYNRILEDGTELDLQPSINAFPIIFEDQEGNTWDIFGEATAGPRAGQRLVPTQAMMGYWFSFASFFPIVTIYGEEMNEKLDSEISGPDWLINQENVFRGAFKDAIPSLDNPVYQSLSGRDLVNPLYVNDEDLTIVIPDQQNLKVIPHKVMDWHESLNDNINGKDVVVGYCPLTGTSTIWNRALNENVLEFGVSGLLYNNNLILYDRQTDSYWSQILQRSVHGNLIGTDPGEINVALEMTWAGVKLLDKGGFKLLSENNGFDRNYSIYPYGDYKTNHERLSFPLTYQDNRIPNKERVLAVIINERSKVYRFEHFK